MIAKVIAAELLKDPEMEVTCSVDISKNESDAGRRAFGDRVMEIITDGSSITICFVGETND